MAKKYIYKVSFDEKIALWTNVDATIESDKPLTEDELNLKIANGEYEEDSTDFDWSDGATRMEVSPVYDYEETIAEEEPKEDENGK